MATKSLIAAFGFAVTAGLALPAIAQVSMKGWYVGASIGQAKARDACNDLAGTGISCDETDTAWKIFAGYQFHANFAAEAGYINLGKASAAGLGLTDQIKSTAWDLSMISSLPVTEPLSLFGRLGVYSADVKEDTNFGVSLSHSNSDLTYGLGLRYSVTRNLGVRAEWQRYHDVGGGDTGKSNVDVLGGAALWSF